MSSSVYNTKNAGTTKSSVVVAIQSQYQPSLPSGQYGNHLRLCSLYAPNNKNADTSVQSAAIADVEITLEEVNRVSTGETYFEVQDWNHLKNSNSGQQLSNFPQWVTTLLTETVQYGVSQVDPAFNIILNSLLELIKKPDHSGAKGRKSLSLSDSRKWSYKKWRSHAGAFLIDIEQAMLPTLHQNANPTGVIEYCATFEAEVGSLLAVSSGGSATPLRSGGRVSESVNFKISWN